MSNNSESTFAFQKISVLSQHFSSSWGLTKPPGVWRGSYGWCSSVGNHLSTLCGLLREICCPGKSFLWMAIWLLKWSWAFLCLSAYGSRALLGVEQLDISRWGWSFLLAAPSPHRVTWSPAVCWWALRGCGSVSGVPDRLSQGSDLRVSSPTLRSCMTSMIVSWIRTQSLLFGPHCKRSDHSSSPWEGCEKPQMSCSRDSVTPLQGMGTLVWEAI